MKAGEIISLPDDKSRRLIDAGYAEPANPDIEKYLILTSTLAACDPKGGCWEWILQNRPSMWRMFIRAFRDGGLAETRKGFGEMVEAWKDQIRRREM